MADSEGLDSSLLDEFSQYFVSLCTIENYTEVTDASGQKARTYVGVGGLTNIPCRVVPIIRLRPNPEQVRTAQLAYSNETHVVLLKGYFTQAQIPTSYRALVDTTEYDIISTESDGNHIATRLRVQIVNV